MSGSSVIWTVIGPEAERARFEAATSTAKNDDSKSTNIVYLTAESPEAALDAIAVAKKNSGGIRVSAEFADRAAESVAEDESSALMLTLRSCDAFERIGARSKRDVTPRWWPRSFLFEGLQRTFAKDVPGIDLSGAALVIGAKRNARVAIGALAKVGFSRFNVIDPDVEAAQALVELMARTYFRASFEVTAPELVTQLPGAHSMVLNSSREASGAMSAELLYMNFFRPGGVWIELELGPDDDALLAEAKQMGGVVESGARVLARADAAWADCAFGQTIDIEAHAERLAGLNRA